MTVKRRCNTNTVATEKVLHKKRQVIGYRITQYTKPETAALRIREVPPLADKPGPVPGDDGVAINSDRGTTATYTLRRLKRDPRPRGRDRWILVQTCTKMRITPPARPRPLRHHLARPDCDPCRVPSPPKSCLQPLPTVSK